MTDGVVVPAGIASWVVQESSQRFEAVTRGETLWFVAGTAVMTVALAYFLFRLVRAPRVRTQHGLVAAVVAIATTAYAVLSLGLGDVTVTIPAVTNGPRRLYWARYVDWGLTTPLLLLGLLWPVSTDRSLLRRAIVLDVGVILGGALAGIATAAVVRYGLWAASTACLGVLLYVLFFEIDDELERLPAVQRVGFLTLRRTFATLWVCYPLVWLLGPNGIGAVGLPGEAFAFLALDVATKVLFGYFLLASQSVDVPSRRAPA